jgi:hypothetical protein
MPSNRSPLFPIALACIVFLPSLTVTKIMAATISFEDLPPLGLELTSYTEEGFTVTSITGRWTLGVVGGPLIPARSVLGSGPIVDCPIPPGPPCGSGTDVVELNLTAGGEFTFTRSGAEPE